jgi:glycosyltransferase involved in cell wall biosynthesis
MRVGLDLLFLVPGRTGGREAYARELIRAMAAVDPDLELTAFVSRDGGARWARQLGVDLRVVNVPIRTSRPEQWAVGELALLPVAGRRAGIELLHSPANFAPLVGPFTRVVTLHDLQYRAVPELLQRGRLAGTSALIPVTARRADRLITGSSAARDEIVAAFGIEPSRIDVIPHGVVEVSVPPRPEADVRAELALGDRAVILCVATALPHKNLERLLEALALIEPARRPVLALAGAGTDGPELTALTESLGLDSDTRLLGFAASGTLERLYVMAGCVVVPTLYEGFGLPVIEAMGRGTPVVCSDIPVLREVAGDAAMRFDPRRPAAIAEAIMAVLEDRGLARRLAEAGLEHARHFTWQHSALETLATYRRALGRPATV